MPRAAGLYRLYAVIAFGGALGVLLALLVAVDATMTRQQSPGGLIATIISSSTMSSDTSAALLLILGAVVSCSMGLGLRALWVECFSQWRAGRLLRGSVRLDPGIDAVRAFADDRPRAFCHGLLRPRIYVSSGTLAALSTSELGALLAHERHHARRHDPLRFAVARVLAGGLFFLPVLPRLLDRYADEAEIAADDAAIAGGQDVAALAAALLTFEASGAGLHPDRVDRLLGERVEPRVPAAWVRSTALIIVAIVGLGLLGATLNGHEYLFVTGVFVAGPALLVAAALALIVPMNLLNGLVGWRSDGPRWTYRRRSRY